MKPNGGGGHVAPLAVATLLAVAIAAAGYTLWRTSRPLVRVAGAVRALQGELLTPALVLVRAGGFNDSVRVTAGGRFALDIPASSDSGCVRIDRALIRPASDAYWPALALGRSWCEGDTLDAVLIPWSYWIPGGAYADQLVTIDIELLFGLGPAHDGLLARQPQRAVLMDSSPISLRFEPCDSAASDGCAAKPGAAAAFWAHVRSLEETLGLDLFAPSKAPDVGAAPHFVVGLIHQRTRRTTMYGPGVLLGRTSNELECRLRRHHGRCVLMASKGGRVSYVTSDRRAQRELPSERVVHHELLHVVGLQHGCMRRSVMCPADWKAVMRGVREAPSLTRSDAAVVHLLADLTRHLERGRVEWGLIEAAWR